MGAGRNGAHGVLVHHSAIKLEKERVLHEYVKTMIPTLSFVMLPVAAAQNGKQVGKNT